LSKERFVVTRTGERVLIGVAAVLALIFIMLVSQPVWAEKPGTVSNLTLPGEGVALF